MPCGKSKYKKLMGKVRKTYPTYSLKRRKKIVGAIYARSKKK